MKKKPNIGMITDNDFPPDIRIEKEAGSLLKSYKIFLLCPQKIKEKKFLIYKNIKITKKFNKYLSFFLFLEILLFQNCWIWKKAIEKFIKKNKINILHVHDLVLLKPSIDAARAAKIPVIADLHENYPAMMQAAMKNPKNLPLALKIIKIFFNFKKIKTYEINCLKSVDKIFVVIEEAEKRLIDRGIPKDKIQVIPNYH